MAESNQVDSLASLVKTVKSRTGHGQVVEFCTALLRDKPKSDEAWTARELLIKAYLDEGEIEKAVELVQQLRKRFGPKSQRVSILEGLTLEAKGEWEKAESVYEAVLKMNWQNMTAAKRLATIKRSKGDLSGASKLLNALITDNHADLESWVEMCDLQMTVGAYEQALFCAEEILIANPHGYLSDCLYAELLLTCARATPVDSSKQKWLADSRTYYSQSLVLRGEQGYSRAAWGLLLCIKAKRTSEAKDELDDQTRQKAAEILRAIYKKSPMKDLVEPVVTQLSS